MNSVSEFASYIAHSLTKGPCERCKTDSQHIHTETCKLVSFTWKYRPHMDQV